MYSFSNFEPILLIILFLWLVGLSVVLFYQRRVLNRLITVDKKGGLKLTIKEVLEVIVANESELKKVGGRLKEIEGQLPLKVEKIGLVRFNPFGNIGSDQSFALALLDSRGDGVIISSLHSRETTRIYAKPVKGHRPDGFDLSEEEKKAIAEAK